jgi:hypothetical protein
MASIHAQISDAQMTMHSNGFTTELWTPSFGWDSDESEASATPFDLQMLAALKIFVWMFCASTKRSWIHLAAEMQAGKTGVICCLIRLVLANYKLLGMKPSDLFVLTGMKDNAWRLQTRKRLPKAVFECVQHNDGLAKVAAALRLKHEKEPLRNVLIMLDESHLASSYTNRPAKLIFDELLRMCPVEQWAERNIRVLTISATDPAKILSIGTTEGAQLVRLYTDALYQSVESLQQAGRIHETEDLITPEAVARLMAFIDTNYTGEPLYHIIRPRQRKVAETIRLLEAASPGCDIVPWDAETKGSSDSSTVSSLMDINDRLSEPPQKITFIVLKNMLYASKTLNDTHVGVLHDRVGAKDDTNLQSLLGRANGYGKSKRTQIFTSGQTVTNYIKTWRDLTTSVSEQTAKELRNKMPAVVVGHSADGTTLTASADAPTPFTSTGASAAAAAAAAPVARHENCVVHVEEFPTMQALNQRWHIISGTTANCRTPNNRDGFYICSIGEKSMKQAATVVRGFISHSTKGWGSGLTEANIGDLISRVYVGYQDDIPIFFLRWTRKA